MTAPAPERAGGYAWYAAALLALAHLVSFVDRYLMSLLVEPMKAHFALDDATLGLLQGTGFAVFYALAMLPAGWLADRFDRRRLIVGALVCWSVATALCGLAASVAGLFAARALLGVGEAALVPAAVSILAATFPRRQLGRATGLFTGGASIGRGAALIVGGMVLAAYAAQGGHVLPLVGRLAPWQATFVALALPGLVLALLALLTLREPPRTPGEARSAGLGEALAHVRGDWRAYALHGGAAAALVLVGQGFGAWSPTFYIRELGMTPLAAGAAIGGVLLAAAPLGHLAGGALIDWLQARRAAAPAAPVIALGLAGALGALLGFANVTGLGNSLLFFALVTFFATLGMPAALAGLQMLAPDRLRGRLSAAFLAATALVGIGAGPPLVGLAADLLGGPHRLGTALQLVLGSAAGLGILLAIASRAPFALAMSRNRPAPA